MELHLKIIGIILIVLAIIHIPFPKYFNWKRELQFVSLVNKQMMYVHTFFISIAVFFMGVLCCYYSNDMVHTKLGRQVSFFLFIFWGLRLLFQFFFYSPRLWKGKRFETFIHILFSAFWVYFTVVFFIIYKT